MKKAAVLLLALAATCRGIESEVVLDTTQPLASLKRLEGFVGASLDVRAYLKQAGQPYTNVSGAALTIYYGTNLTAATRGAATGGVITAAGACLVRIPAAGAAIPNGVYLPVLVQGGVTNALGYGTLNIRATSFTGQGTLELGPTTINCDNYTLTGSDPWFRTSQGVTVASLNSYSNWAATVYATTAMLTSSGGLWRAEWQAYAAQQAGLTNAAHIAASDPHGDRAYSVALLASGTAARAVYADTAGSATNVPWSGLTGTQPKLNAATNADYATTAGTVTGGQSNLIAGAAVASVVNTQVWTAAQYPLAWTNPASATNWTWTKTASAVTLTGYTGPNDVVVPDMLDNLPVTSYGILFSYTAITSIRGGEYVTTIDGNAFDTCTALTNAVFPSVSIVGPLAFSDCSSLAKVYFSQNAPVDYGNAYNGAANVTNYVTNPTATGWGATWNGRPVVRMPIFADAVTIAGTNLQTTLAGKLDTTGNGSGLTGLTVGQVAGAAVAETVVTGAVVTVQSGGRYFFTTDTNVVLSASLTGGQVVNLAIIRNTATNAITATAESSAWKWTGGTMTNSIPAGTMMTFGWACNPFTGATNCYATAASVN